MRMRGVRAPRPINYTTESFRTSQADAYSIPLNYGIEVNILRAGSPFPPSTWINKIDTGTARTSRGMLGIGPNWPRVPALYGASQRTNPAPVQKAGGHFKVGAPNTNRWSSANLRAYQAAQINQSKALGNPGIYNANPPPQQNG